MNFKKNKKIAALSAVIFSSVSPSLTYAADDSWFSTDTLNGVYHFSYEWLTNNRAANSFKGLLEDIKWLTPDPVEDALVNGGVWATNRVMTSFRGATDDILFFTPDAVEEAVYDAGAFTFNRISTNLFATIDDVCAAYEISNDAVNSINNYFSFNKNNKAYLVVTKNGKEAFRQIFEFANNGNNDFYIILGNSEYHYIDGKLFDANGNEKIIAFNDDHDVTTATFVSTTSLQEIDAFFQQKLMKSKQLREKRELATNNTLDGVASSMASVGISTAALITDSVTDAVSAVQSTGGRRVGALMSGRMIIDNLAPEELQASTRANHYNPVFNRGPGSWHTFIEASGLKGGWKQRKNHPGHSFSSYGLNAGVFKELNENWIAGAMIGSHKTHAKIKDNNRKINVDSIVFGPFLSWTKNNWHIDTAVMMSSNDYSSSRKGLLNDTLKADYKGTDLSGYLGVGYDISLDHKIPGLTVTPKAEVIYVDSSHDEYKEKSSSGNNPQAIQAVKKSNHATTLKLGAEVAYLLQNLEKPTELGFSLGVQQLSVSDYGTHYSYHQSTSESSSSTPYNSPAVSDNGFYYEARATRLISDTTTFNVEFLGTQGRKSHSNGIKFTLEKKF